MNFILGFFIALGILLILNFTVLAGMPPGLMLGINILVALAIGLVVRALNSRGD